MTASRLPAGADEVCRGLYAHRLLTTSQVAELYLYPTSLRWARTVLGALEAARYVARVGVIGSRENAWYLTGRGYTATEGGGGERRPYRITPELAGGDYARHTIATNDVGLAFVRAARLRGDDCGPFAWRNECSHALGPGRSRGDRLIVDAVVEYVVRSPGGDTWLTRFIELDRASTLVSVLAAKLSAYARLLDYAPGWADRYSSFPRLLIVLDGDTPEALERRLLALRRAVGRIPALATRRELVAHVAPLAGLLDRGPFARVVTPLFGEPILVDVLG